jgi:glutamate-1-semialdehyde 2,1-aminomutase
MQNINHSIELFKKANQFIPGGVNSPVRSFSGVGGTPRFIAHAKGSHITDVDNNHYTDYVGSWGPMILGHAHPEVIEAIQKAAEKGLSYGAPTEIETLLAEKITQLMPNIKKIRMVNSGTEATMTALRIARGFTKKNKIIKFAGCYHGHEDALLVKAGSGVATLGLPSCAGVPTSVTENTLVAEFNQLDQVEMLFKQYPDDIAAVIVEPVAGNMGCILPKPEFLIGIQNLCQQYHSVFIADEVMTGFRVALGGAQAKYNLTPDLTTLGKIIGGGMPVGAIGGREDIMSVLAPIGAVYQAGTLSGNPIAMTAGLKTLEIIERDPQFYQKLEQKSRTLTQGILEIAHRLNIPMQTVIAGGMFGIWFTDQQAPHNYEEAKACDTTRFSTFFHNMLEFGVYLPPSAFEAWFMSIAHSDNEIEQTLKAVEKSLLAL